MILEIWNNINGFHWNVDASNWNLASGKGLKTKSGAEKSARRICAKMGVKIHRVCDRTTSQ